MSLTPSPFSFRATTPVALREIARVLGDARVVGDAEVGVVGVRHDSRQVEPGELFAARKGAQADGLGHVTEALARGAAAVMAARDTTAEALGVPLLLVDDVRHAMARAAFLVYGQPAQSLDVVGITGTNGKTTTSHLVAAALRRSGRRPGLLGTVGYEFEDLALAAPHTTPEADETARLAAAMRARGATHLVMEVSSHALAQGRVLGMRFRVAAFTNLTQDHLDFHGDMAAYGEAKARLFIDLAPAACVINVDDPFGETLARRASAPVIRVSNEIGAAADIVPLSVHKDARRTRAMLRTPKGTVEIDSSLVGGHNLSNMVVALGVALALGLDPDAAAQAFADVAVPGRLERCDGPDDDVVVVVDYAHTPDALLRVLAALRELAHGGELAGSGRLQCIFGCGGDRDPKKRAPMGRAVAAMADLAVVTTDNPRSEDPRAIADAVLIGTGSGPNVVVELDRARAIAHTIEHARTGDVVLIAGKGHETYQIVGATRVPFDDRVEARQALARRRQARRGAS